MKLADWSRVRRLACTTAPPASADAWKPESGAVTELVDSIETDEPSWRRRCASRDRFPVAPLPVILDPTARCFNRRHRLTLDSCAPQDPTKPGADHEHNNDQPPHAEAQGQGSSPGTRDRFGLIVHAGLVRGRVEVCSLRSLRRPSDVTDRWFPYHSMSCCRTWATYGNPRLIVAFGRSFLSSWRP